MRAEIRSHFTMPIVIAALADAASRCGRGNEFLAHPRGYRSSGCDLQDGGMGEDLRAAANSRRRTPAAWRNFGL